MTKARKRAEGGYTLTEVLVAVSILSVSIVVIVGAMSAGILGSRVHRDIVTSDAVSRRFAEQIVSGPYVACATPSSYTLSNPPAGFTAHVTDVKYWNGAAAGSPATFGAGPCTSDAGMQQITHVVQGAGGDGSQTIQIVKRHP
jgi:prepilin-type N-terminal cleavage/methylation domain-containing protein